MRRPKGGADAVWSGVAEGWIGTGRGEPGEQTERREVERGGKGGGERRGWAAREGNATRTRERESREISRVGFVCVRVCVVEARLIVEQKGAAGQNEGMTQKKARPLAAAGLIRDPYFCTPPAGEVYPAAR